MEFKESLLRKIVLIEILAGGTITVRKMEERAQESLALIVLLEKLLRESTFLGRDVQDLTVVILRTKVLCQHTAYVVATGAKLASYVNDDLFLHKSLTF